MEFSVVRWDNGRVVLLDQTRLPDEEIYLACATQKDGTAGILRAARATRHARRAREEGQGQSADRRGADGGGGRGESPGGTRNGHEAG